MFVIHTEYIHWGILVHVHTASWPFLPPLSLCFLQFPPSPAGRSLSCFLAAGIWTTDLTSSFHVTEAALTVMLFYKVERPDIKGLGPLGYSWTISMRVSHERKLEDFSLQATSVQGTLSLATIRLAWPTVFGSSKFSKMRAQLPQLRHKGLKATCNLLRKTKWWLGSQPI